MIFVAKRYLTVARDILAVMVGSGYSWPVMCGDMGHSSMCCDAQDRYLRHGISQSGISLVLRLGSCRTSCYTSECVLTAVLLSKHVS